MELKRFIFLPHVETIIRFIVLTCVCVPVFAITTYNDNYVLTLKVAYKTTYFIDQHIKEKTFCIYDEFLKDDEVTNILPELDNVFIVKNSESLDECNFVYISKRSFEPKMLKLISKSEQVFISDDKDFIKKGGIIGLYLEENKVKISINKTTADKKNIKISSQLLALAKSVK